MTRELGPILVAPLLPQARGTLAPGARLIVLTAAQPPVTTSVETIVGSQADLRA